jgi:hypothetical protein
MAKFTLDQIEKKFSAIPDTMRRLAEIKSHLAARSVSLRIARRSALELDMHPAGSNLQPYDAKSCTTPGGRGSSVRKLLKMAKKWLKCLFGRLSKRRKCLIKDNLPRMDSNHDKVIQSLLWSMIGYEPI